jgi:tripartite-type tricarboxylate transporter receptor subunit TctC
MATEVYPSANSETTHMNFPHIRRALLAMALGLAAIGAQAAWPDRPITFVVTYAAGGGADLMGRLLASKMSATLGQSIVVLNRAGGGAGQIGASYVARSAPDGYTVMVDAGGYAINPGLYESLPYNPAKDFTTIGVAALFPHVLVVTPNVKANTAPELAALSKTTPLFFASSGIGSSQHIAAELFMQSTGAKMTHVPYKGGGPAMVDVMGGQTPVFFSNVASTLSYIESKKLKALGVAGSKRVAAIPNVPTMDEQGIKGTEMYEWNGVFVPSGTPLPIVEKLADAMKKALESPDVKERVSSLGGEIFAGDRQQAITWIADQTKRMTEVVKRNNIHPQ